MTPAATGTPLAVIAPPVQSVVQPFPTTASAATVPVGNQKTTVVGNGIPAAQSPVGNPAQQQPLPATTTPAAPAATASNKNHLPTSLPPPAVTFPTSGKSNVVPMFPTGGKPRKSNQFPTSGKSPISGKNPASQKFPTSGKKANGKPPKPKPPVGVQAEMDWRESAHQSGSSFTLLFRPYEMVAGKKQRLSSSYVCYIDVEQWELLQLLTEDRRLNYVQAEFNDWWESNCQAQGNARASR